MIGIDGNGTDYCVAATQTGDPTGAWNRFGFRTNVKRAFFGFPHMGVGVDAIYMGSNQFGGGLFFGFEGRVFAMDKSDLYNGTTLDVVTRELAPAGMEGPRNVKLDSTPQPAQLHGVSDGSFPTGGPHFIMAEFFDGKSHAIYMWNDPFGADELDLVGDVDLAAASGVPCENFSCFPIPWPQKGSVEILEGNDYRGQETEYRNGFLWTTQTISCNPGRGTRDCIRWAQIDPNQVVPGKLDSSGSLDSTINGRRACSPAIGGFAPFLRWPPTSVRTWRSDTPSARCPRTPAGPGFRPSSSPAAAAPIRSARSAASVYWSRRKPPTARSRTTAGNPLSVGATTRA
ncbi:MAG TPA: hypothetical protein VE175_11350 [Woeseiaceae bacterium]|nr:hypothetical protein [Woeseiaceae bacterium]